MSKRPKKIEVNEGPEAAKKFEEALKEMLSVPAEKIRAAKKEDRERRKKNGH